MERLDVGKCSVDGIVRILFFDAGRLFHWTIIPVGKGDHLSPIYFESLTAKNVLFVNKWHCIYRMIREVRENCLE
jgi:hypothetical protein